MERKEQRPRFPLGKHPYKIAISREEVSLAYRYRCATGEPIQSLVRRLLREYCQNYQEKEEGEFKPENQAT